MIAKMTDPNLIDHYLIDCAIPLKSAIENCYHIDFGNPADVNGLVMLQYNLEVGLRSTLFSLTQQHRIICSIFLEAF